MSRTATVPLLLTFYCLIADTPGRSPQQPLPVQRHELFDMLVRRLLRGAWSFEGRKVEVAIDECISTLAVWARAAAEGAMLSSGLGEWGQTFIQPTHPNILHLPALEAVAPLVRVTDEGEIVRSFVHRTIQEHLLAQDVSHQTAADAAQAILPHLWFDPDWRETIPVAISEHNRRQPGALLEHLLRLLPQAGNVPDVARAAAMDQVDNLLAATMRESTPAEWSDAHQKVLRKAWERCTWYGPQVSIGSAFWPQSSDKWAERPVGDRPVTPPSWPMTERTYPLIELAKASPRARQRRMDLQPVIATPVLLEGSAEEAPTDISVARDGSQLLRVAHSLAQAEAPVGHRDAVAQALLDWLEAASPRKVPRILRAIGELDPSPPFRQRALEQAERLVEIDFSRSATIEILNACGAIAADLEDSRVVIRIALMAMHRVPIHTLGLLVELIWLHGASSSDMHAIGKLILRRVSDCDPAYVPTLADLLVSGIAPDEEIAECIERLFRRLYRVSSPNTVSILTGLLALDLSEIDRDRVRDFIAKQLASSSATEAMTLVPFLRRVCSLEYWLEWLRG